MTEFNLSGCEVLYRGNDDGTGEEWKKVEDVKEFIRLRNKLNEEIVRAYLDTYLCREKKFKLLRDGIIGEMKEKGDKLAGDKLIEKEQEK